MPRLATSFDVGLARGLIQSGQRDEAVVARLVSAGLERQTATRMVQELREGRRPDLDTPRSLEGSNREKSTSVQSADNVASTNRNGVDVRLARKIKFGIWLSLWAAFATPWHDILHIRRLRQPPGETIDWSVLICTKLFGGIILLILVNFMWLLFVTFPLMVWKRQFDRTPRRLAGSYIVMGLILLPSGLWLTWAYTVGGYAIVFYGMIGCGLVLIVQGIGALLFNSKNLGVLAAIYFIVGWLIYTLIHNLR